MMFGIFNGTGRFMEVCGFRFKIGSDRKPRKILIGQIVIEFYSYAKSFRFDITPIMVW